MNAISECGFPENLKCLHAEYENIVHVQKNKNDGLIVQDPLAVILTALISSQHYADELKLI